MNCRHSLALVVLVGLSGCWVDETGYNNPDAQDAADPTDDLGVEPPATADGGAEDDAVPDAERGGQILHTSAQVLTSGQAADIYVLGLAGVIEPGEEAELFVGGVSVGTAEGSLLGTFVAEVSVTLGDQLTVEVPAETLLYDVLDDLDSLDAPEVAFDDKDSDPWVLESGAARPDAQLLQAPFVIFAPGNGEAAVQEAGAAPVAVAAEVGDTVCVADMDDDGLVGVATCSQL